ncbi:hypothetical protein K435DRAFT_877979 [Dendrothele bispora CBS 962.96]|uniref:Chromo domain-containing protein n=1 Tax=Dendrothele bispora (strain CBS 962.96) TaxID=1314807 RepID=A0A4S8KNU5_DENBC|nr:hypothetical protein K435DRAFT_877979 [Dendrothele bispora CBS 962.96]
MSSVQRSTAGWLKTREQIIGNVIQVPQSLLSSDGVGDAHTYGKRERLLLYFLRQNTIYNPMSIEPDEYNSICFAYSASSERPPLLLSERISGLPVPVTFALPDSTSLSSPSYPWSAVTPLYCMTPSGSLGSLSHLAASSTSTISSSSLSSSNHIRSIDKAFIEAMEQRKQEEKRRHVFRYGLDLEDIDPVSPPSLEDPQFHWETSRLSPRIDDLPPVTLVPNPSIATAPIPFYFPKSPEYTRNDIPDPRFRRGYCYTTSIDVINKQQESERLYKILAPPGVDSEPSTSYDPISQRFVTKPIEGMIPLPPGFPFAIILDNDPTKHITIACLQTMDSLSQYVEFPLIERLVKDVWAESFGTKDTPPISRLGLKPNSRSGPVQAGLVDGSYSLGVTMGEGQGIGIIQPTSQVNTVDGTVKILRLLSTLHELWRLIVPLCVSKQEWDAWNFRSEDMNVFCPGGNRPAYTSCQLNISSFRHGGSLEEAIGMASGAFHVDFNDDKNGWTLVMGLLRIPPGSAVGDFLLARPGLYARLETDASGQTTFFLLFKGNDIHSGSAPKTDDAAWTSFISELNDLYESVGDENRMVYILYPSHTAFHRSGGMAFSNRSGFGNEDGSSMKVKKQAHTFASDCYQLKSFDDNKEWLMREAFMNDYNRSQDLGIVLPSLPSYRPLLSLTPIFMRPLLDPEKAADIFARMRGLYRNLHDNNAQYYLNMKKLTITRKHRELTTEYLTNLAQDTNPTPSGSKAGGKQPITRSQRAILKRPVQQDNSSDDLSDIEDGVYCIKGIKGERKTKKGFLEYLVLWRDGGQSWLRATEVDEEAIRLWKSSGSNPAVKRARHQRSSSSVVRPIDTGSEAYKSLTALLDPENLLQEYQDVQQLRSSLDSADPSNAACYHFISITEGFQKSYNHWDSQLLFQDEGGLTVLTNLEAGARLLKDSAVTQRLVKLQQRSLNLAICRSLRFIYLWYTSWSSLVTSSLFNDLTATRNVENNEAFLAKWSSSVAQFARAILDWVETVSKAKKRQTSVPSLTLPYDIYGFYKPSIVSQKDKVDISYSPSHSKSLRNAQQRQAYAEETFQDILTKYTIIPGVEALDKSLNSPRRNVFEVDDIKARCILRGALLECLVDWLDDDCLFVSSQIQAVLVSPAMLFKDDFGKVPEDLALSSKVLHGESPFGALASLLWEEFDWVAALEAAEPLSITVQDIIAKLAKKEDSQKGKPHGRLGKRKQRVTFYAGLKDKPRVPEGTPLEDLFPWTDGLRLDKVACILKETLHFKRNETGHSILRHILECQHPTINSSARSNDPDHYNPIRSSNCFQRLLRESLGTSHPLSSPYGLSNILVRIGTGQGSKTETFATRYLNRWFTSAQDCVSAFQQAWNTDANMALENCRIWGSPAAALQFARTSPTHPPDFKSRIDPMFDSKIVQLWVDFCSNAQHAYADALTLAEKTEVPGFKSGLT